MRRLDGLSTFLLVREEPHAYQHTLKIGIFDVKGVSGGWSFEYFRDNILHRLQWIPMCRYKVMHVPLGLHRPVWVEDLEFDIDNHLRYVSCPPPGDNKALCALISQIYANPLDQSKPLWLTWVIDGLADGRVAVVTLLHHAYTDGTGFARLIERIFTKEPDSQLPSLEDWRPGKPPSRVQLLLGALRELPLTLFRTLPRVVHGVRESRRLNRAYASSGHSPSPNPFRDSRDSPFNMLLSRGRTFVFEAIPLSKVKDVARSFDVTINDLYIAVVADVYRRFMLERGYNVDKGPLLSSIPLARRPPPELDDNMGNMTSIDYLWIPIHLADPMERLRFAHDASLEMKAHFTATEGADPLTIMEILPLPLFLLPDWLVKHSKTAVGMNGNAVISNVRGPAEHLYLGQMKLTNWISTGQILQGMAVNTTVWSYAENFNMCILADKKLLSDGWPLMEWFKASIGGYEELAGIRQKQAQRGD